MAFMQINVCRQAWRDLISVVSSNSDEWKVFNWRRPKHLCLGQLLGAHVYNTVSPNKSGPIAADAADACNSH